MTPTARETFAANLLRERRRLHLSQEALSFACDLNVSEISRLERATRDPRLATIVKLGNALGIPPRGCSTASRKAPAAWHFPCAQ